LDKGEETMPHFDRTVSKRPPPVPEVRVLSDADAVALLAAQHFVELARASILSRARFTVALSGGTTPRRMYERLAAPPFRDRVDWSRVEVFWGDERGVPPDHPDSNFRMAADALLDLVPIPRARIHRIRGERADLGSAARDYQVEIARAFQVYERGRPPSFDLLLLGMGNDGHTASLFPGSDALREQSRWTLDVEGTKPPPHRVTFTVPILNRAREIRFLVAGGDKAARLREVLEGPHEPARMPVQLVAPEDGRLIWLVDEAAASELDRTPALAGGSKR
jgi:6-phosphogluconolactonase